MIKINFDFELSDREKAVALVEGTGILILVAILFFNQPFAAILMAPYLYIFLRNRERQLIAKRNQEIGRQFKDGMLAISASLAVGYSVENAFSGAVAEIENLYGKNAVMAEEFRLIEKQLGLNENVEDSLEKMAKRIQLEEATYFAEVFRYAKRSGGNLIEIIQKTAENISDKIEVREDINVVISGKKMEQKVMNLMPFGIITYLRFGAYEFIAPLYGNILGVATMCVCLAGYMGAKILSERITDIKV